MTPTNSLSAGSLSVRFYKSNDRLEHMIGIDTTSSFVPVLESVEGTPQDSWPSSPPMQQIVEEKIAADNHPVLLGVGLSGNGHWSLAIETHRNSMLKFDIACKNSRSSDTLGSKYRISTGWSLDSGYECGCKTVKLVRTTHMFTSSKIHLFATIGELKLDESERLIQFFPESDPSKMLTHRWCYEVAIADGV